VQTSVPPTNPNANLLLVIHGNEAGLIIRGRGSSLLGASFGANFVPNEHSLTSGRHPIAFYAVDWDEDVSWPRSETIRVVEAPTPTDENSSPLSGGVIAAIVIGSVLGGALILGAVVGFPRWKKSAVASQGGPSTARSLQFVRSFRVNLQFVQSEPRPGMPARKRLSLLEVLDARAAMKFAITNGRHIKEGDCSFEGMAGRNG
jgi:hypothetical protein